MKHIKTTTAAEEAVRGMYKVAGDLTPAVAEQADIDLLSKIVALTEESDRLKAEASELKAKIMAKMGEHASLIGPGGIELVSWKQAKEKAVIDYEGILIELRADPALVQKYTSVKAGARTFKILDEAVAVSSASSSSSSSENK